MIVLSLSSHTHTHNRSIKLAVMIKFEAAQPALLYLVPACLGSSFLTAVTRGEVKQMLAYSEEVEDSDSEEKKKEDEKPASDKKAD
jgi:minor histocompatibility antigen H13